jgi:hypothetical protein
MYRDAFTDELNLETLTNEYVEWTRLYGIGRNFNDLRFGQYLVAKYHKMGMSCPHIFYMESARSVYCALAMDYL